MNGVNAPHPNISQEFCLSYRNMFGCSVLLLCIAPSDNIFLTIEHNVIICTPTSAGYKYLCTALQIPLTILKLTQLLSK